jgi:hypothetical protein
VALTAILLPRVSLLAAVAIALGSYQAIGYLSGSIEYLAAGADGAAVFVGLFVIVPLAVAGTVLVATGTRWSRTSIRG